MSAAPDLDEFLAEATAFLDEHAERRSAGEHDDEMLWGKGEFDVSPYLTPYSDVAALLVFNHQTQMSNLLIRLNWVTRVEEYEKRPAPAGGEDDPVAQAAAELVDYMLFVDEAPLPGPVKGRSNFARTFTATGPRDAQ